MNNPAVLADSVQSVNWTLEILKMVAPGLWVLLGLWVWHRQKHSEPRYDSFKYLAQKQLDSLMKAWTLLAYMTPVENPRAVLVWKDDGNKTYYIRPKQAEDYISQLSEVFYGCGCGLLLESKVKDLCYKYRNHLYGVLLKEKGKPAREEGILIEKIELVRSLEGIYTELNTELREELKKIKI